MDAPLYQRGILAYGKHRFGKDWMFPKSKLYPKERFRYLNGGLQLWSREGRQKARKHFTSVDHYVLHTRYTEQMYINLQLSQPVFNVFRGKNTCFETQVLPGILLPLPVFLLL